MLSPICRENRSEIPLRIRAAFDNKRRAQNAYRHRRSHFCFSVGLAPKAKGSKLAGIPIIVLKSLEQEYPPSGHNICETASAQQIWESYRQATPYPDHRDGKTWKPFHELNPGHLQHTVYENDSAIIRDSKTNDIVCLVIRNFTNGNKRLLEWINGIIVENNNVRRSVRVGSFVSSILAGYLNFFLARGSWEVVPDRLHFWCTKLPSIRVGAESSEQSG